MSKTICRIKTDWFNRGDSLVKQKSIRVLKRKSSGFDLLNESANMVGVEDALEDIVNFDECDDGIYQLITNNWSTDWETGLIEDVDFKLIPVDDDE